MDIKDRIKALRQAVGLNQTQFGERIAVKQSTITAYECGNRTPLEANLNSMCREFNVSPQWLKTGEGEMFKTVPESAAQTIAKLLDMSEDDPRFKWCVAIADMSDEQIECLRVVLDKLTR